MVKLNELMSNHYFGMVKLEELTTGIKKYHRSFAAN